MDSSKTVYRWMLRQRHIWFYETFDTRIQQGLVSPRCGSKTQVWAILLKLACQIWHRSLSAFLPGLIRLLVPSMVSLARRFWILAHSFRLGMQLRHPQPLTCFVPQSSATLAAWPATASRPPLAASKTYGPSGLSVRGGVQSCFESSAKLPILAMLLHMLSDKVRQHAETRPSGWSALPVDQPAFFASGLQQQHAEADLLL